jgi:hypothetical protein
MAREAGDVLVRSRGDREPGVIERSSSPLRCCVAGGARCRESRSRVVRISRRIVNRAVAAVAILRSPFIDAVHMARRTRGGGVFAGERERSGAVIEYGSGPLRRAVTGLAGLRESCRDVIRIGRRLELGEVAGDAGRRQRRVLPVKVAAGASGCGVLAGQGESRGAVVERRSGPLSRAVTQRTILREARGRVIRVGRRLIQWQVARGTRGSEPRKLTTHVTAGASGRRMFSGERETGTRMIEGRRCPRRGSVAGLARCWKSSMARVSRGLICR